MHLLKLLSLAPVVALGLYIPWLVDDIAWDIVPWLSALDHDVKVPVQLGVMSRCPDALYCEKVFDNVLEKSRDKIDLSLTYLGRVDPSEPDFGVKCMHGPEECAGNIQQLCVAKYMPRSIWWNFVQCQNHKGRKFIGNPELAHKCAKTVGFDWESSPVAVCAGKDGSGKAPEGVALLKQSINLADDLGIQKSCTILINRRNVCVHDGGWKECKGGHAVDDFVRQIDEEYKRLNNVRVA